MILVKTLTVNMKNTIPVYHPYDDSFINDPDSMKFQFASFEDFLHNDLHCSIDAVLGMHVDTHSKKKTRALRVLNNPHRERPIPRGKKKKYPTKPKNNSKIQKMKSKKDPFNLL